MNDSTRGGVAVSIWDDIDALKKKHELELSKTRSHLHDTYGKREANSLRIMTDGRWRALCDGREYFAFTAARLIEQLPKKKS